MRMITLFVHCKGFFKRLSLSRHMKKCFAIKKDENNQQRPLSQSLVYAACHKKYGEILNKLAVKEKIFSKMLPDAIASAAMNDILIIYWGEDLLKKNKNKRSIYHLSNKLRECGKFLLAIRNLGSYNDMLSVLKPESFDDIIEATKLMSNYDLINRNFGAPSLALHFGTSLKSIASLAIKLILRKKVPLGINDIEKTLIDIERFQKIVETQWSTELGSLALKDLNEKNSIKPKLLPVTEDIMKLKQYVENKAEESYRELKSSKNLESYRILTETTLISTILHNRKRVGDIQYLELKDYSDQLKNRENKITNEFTEALTEKEKILTQNYMRIVAIGKGSRSVVILIPKNFQKYFPMIYNIRQNSTWFPPENTYFFTYPKSLRWINGCNVIRKYSKKCNAKHPELLTSSRLRKHIATVTQVLSLKQNEMKQLAKFMGHTLKTHETFYK